MKFIAPLSVLVLVMIDQLTKMWTTHHFLGHLFPTLEMYQNQLGGQMIAPNIELWPGVFELTFVANTGAAFGMMQGRQTFFILMTVVVIGIIIWFWRSIPQNKAGLWMKIAFVLVISGGIGNVIDRFFLNYVRDMLYFSLIDFPVFNVADMCVVGGVILLFPILLLGDIENKKEIKE